MKKLFAAFVFAALPALSFAAGGHDVHLDKVDIDLTDKAAMQDGARTFANYCMGCHSAKFQRYERVGKDLDIPEELMLQNLVFTGAKIGDHMKIGMQPQDAKTWFGNSVIEIETELLPAELLKRLKQIEEEMGRKRVKGKRWGSRIIDLDILFFDNETIDKRNLKVPHPRLAGRRFVLVPLSELAPQLIHPALNLSVSELLATTKDKKKIHLMGAGD